MTILVLYIFNLSTFLTTPPVDSSKFYIMDPDPKNDILGMFSNIDFLHECFGVKLRNLSKNFYSFSCFGRNLWDRS